MENIIIIGLGNILCGDDGFGTHIIERLYEEYEFPENVLLVDGGTQGAALFRFIEQADKLLIYDAVDFGLPEGELIFRTNEAIPLWLGAKKISAHQNSFAELMALASLKNVLPDSCALVGIQPQITDFGSKLTNKIQARFQEAISLGLECLANWGIYPHRNQSERHLVTTEILTSDFYNLSGNVTF